MKNIKILFLAFACSAIGCSDKVIDTPDSGAGFSKSFIQLYLFPEEAVVMDLWIPNYIGLYMEGKTIDFMSYKDSVAFRKLSEKYGDTSFNSKLVPFTNKVIGDEFTSIEITSDKDFDAKHKKGDSLADLVTMEATSPRKFILNGYKEDDDMNDLSSDYVPIHYTRSYGYWPVNKLVSELSPEDLLLLDTKVYFKFNSLPETERIHTITIVFKNAEKEISVSTEMVFKLG